MDGKYESNVVSLSLSLSLSEKQNCKRSKEQKHPLIYFSELYSSRQKRGLQIDFRPSSTKISKSFPLEPMGILFSCPFADFDDAEENIESLIVRSISFKDDNVMTVVRSVSFNGRNSETRILKSIGSGKMILEGSVSFRSRDSELFQLETTVSIKAPSSNTPKESELRSNSFNRKDSPSQFQATSTITDTEQNSPAAELSSPKHEAALKLQKVYKSFRTRRRLADCAVLAEQCWWKLLDFAELKRSSVSFFDIGKPETAASRWFRATTRVAKVGKGLSKDEKARQLALQHWLEAIDPRHRYGHNLHFYYDNWFHCKSRQPFFYWLDVGEGKEVNLEQCSRTKLQQQCIKYLGPKERDAYEVEVEDGKFIYKKSRKLVDTSEEHKDTKWIFVLSTSKILYVGKKKKGVFQHSSFLAGGATSAAGRLVVGNGTLKTVWPHSGHYRPTKENFQEFLNFLREKNVDLTDVKESPTDEDDYSLSNQENSISLRSNSSALDLGQAISILATNDDNSKHDGLKQSQESDDTCISHIPKSTNSFEKLENEGQTGNETVEESSISEQNFMLHKRNLFEEEKNDDEEIPKESILQRINSLKGMESYQLGKQLSCKWTTGAGPRIGCVRDYPTELQFRALEQVHLSPRSAGNYRSCASLWNTASPRPKASTSLLKDSSSSSYYNHHC